MASGQEVSVALLADAPNSHAGKTIDELFPETKAEPPAPERSFAELMEELRARPRLHERFAFALETSGGTKYEGEAPSSAHGFGFSVLWNWLRPERVSVSLHTYTLDDLTERRSLNDLVREYIPIGGMARLTLVA